MVRRQQLIVNQNWRHCDCPLALLSYFRPWSKHLQPSFLSDISSLVEAIIQERINAVSCIPLVSAPPPQLQLSRGSSSKHFETVGWDWMKSTTDYFSFSPKLCACKTAASAVKSRAQLRSDVTSEVMITSIWCEDFGTRARKAVHSLVEEQRV